MSVEQLYNIATMLLEILNEIRGLRKDIVDLVIELKGGAEK